MEQQLDELRQEIYDMREQVRLLTEAVNSLTGTTKRMDSHIDFVEQTYASLRPPLDYIRGRWWGSENQLPEHPNQPTNLLQN